MKHTRPDDPRRSLAAASQHEIVERAEAYIRLHFGAPLPVSTLSRLVGRSERGLRQAFYSVRGMGPKRYERAGRLQAAHDALSDVLKRPPSVTDVASEYGFFELGRFAATYKEAFGETPSETLRRTNRKAIAERSSITRRERQCLHERMSGTSSITSHAHPGTSQ